jgi:CCR4-NOT transcription complex subunit 3
LDASLTQQPGAEIDTKLPSSLGDLVSSFESIRSKALSGSEDPQYTNRMLESSLQHVPDLIDSER